MKTTRISLFLSAVALLSATFLHPTPAESAGPAAVMTHVLGTVQVRSGSGWRQSVQSQGLYAGSTLRTGRNSRGQLRYTDGTVVRLGSNTVLRVRAARDLSLVRGKTWMQKQKNDQRIRVRTPIAQATVVGTELFVSHNAENNSSHVTTLNGQVEVTTDKGESTMVGPGEWVEIEADKPLEAPTKFDWNTLKKEERFLLDLNFVPADDQEVDSDGSWR